MYKAVHLYLYSLPSNKNLQFLFRLGHNFINPSSLISSDIEFGSDLTM